MNLVWFRSDLRITDNSALCNAANAGDVISCCLLPVQQWKKYGWGERKINFIRSSAEQLQANLKAMGIQLQIKDVDSFKDQSNEILSICSQYNIQNVFWNNEYPLDERNRDASIHNKLEENGIRCSRSDGALVLPPGSVTTQQGDIYKVFTPFKRSWIQKVEGCPIDLVTINHSGNIFSPIERKAPIQRVSPGEASALNSLDTFTGQTVDNYQNRRDIPSEKATSAISAHLSAGTVSPRTCLKKAIAANNFELSTGNSGVITWVSQLIWREFYYHLIATQNRLSKSQPFKTETNNIHWNNPAQSFQDWKAGTTGVPIVDAGMRQLNSTGWMHNRVRMITAMYLTKNLLIDWRLGERYFLKKLIDADFALNNGGWQWSASTGTDSAPYFRVFNPFSQSKRFDPEAAYIKLFVPELKDTASSILHNEEKLKTAKPLNYPSPVTNTKTSRAGAIAAFKNLKIS